MRRVTICMLLLLFCSCATTKFYVVRHAEKESQTTGSTDVPLTAAGQQRAVALKEKLRKEKISAIYSTNTLRTRSTAAPLSTAKGVPLRLYNPIDTVFVDSMRQQAKGAVLIVGHSNTVDDLVNRLYGKQLLYDLPDTQYGDLFLLRRHRGKTRFRHLHFGN